MAGGARYTTYRVSGSMLRAFWFAVVVAAVGLILQLSGDDEWDGTARAWIIVGFVVLIGVVVAWVYRSATVVTSEYLAVRGLLRTRRFPWSDVQAIAVEINPGWFATAEAPRRLVNLYHRDGRRIALPHVNEKNLVNEYGGLDGAADGMRAAWEQGRGAGWVPVPEVQLKAAERARYGVSPWVSGLGWASLTVAVQIVIFMVALIGELEAPWPFFYLFEPEAILVVPAVVFFAASIGAIIKRRRARGAVPRTGSSK